MSDADNPIRNISDTARWAAVYRARETERADAVFLDPLARKLAGERGERIASTMAFSDQNAWSWIARTYLFDQYVAQQVTHGTDMVVNLGAGLDSRPYRMKLPPTLKWIEVDLPEILEYKREILRDEKPACVVERISIDLSNESCRRSLFADLGGRARNALIITEGFITYLSADQVAQLAKDLAAAAGFTHWVLDLASPGLLELLQKNMNQQLEQSGSRLQFGPAEGPGFFQPHGWKPVGVRSLLKTAASLKRLSLKMRLISLLPESKGRQGKRPWAGVCLLALQT
ncbi:MAG TPA: SAM-dependent methyltransferase [Humisphaera sp.]|nr:SAM-dependent methyltransferase [Humisphaera sp.]